LATNPIVVFDQLCSSGPRGLSVPVIGTGIWFDRGVIAASTVVVTLPSSSG